MIRVEDLDFSYAERTVLQGINLEIKAGDILSVLGPNGCGKSTLLRLLRGVLTPESGQILWERTDAFRLGRKAMAQRVAVVPQSTQTSFPFPVQEMVAMGRFAWQSRFSGATSEDRKAVEKALAVTDTLHLAKRKITTLSGGELQRVLLARALAQQAPVLLLDEASNHLDLDHRLEFTELLLRLNREQGTTIVQVSHDLDQAAEISRQILLLADNGSPVALGSPTEVYTSTNLRKVFRVEVKIESSPYTGAPRTYPLRRCGTGPQKLPPIHLICGGGSGAELMRKLHLAGAALSLGPLNRGDSDQVLAAALELETILEESFCPFSTATLQAVRSSCYKAEVLVVAPSVWGPGNLSCLVLAQEVRKRKMAVFLVDPKPDRDFTHGKAWELLQSIQEAGGQIVPDAEALIDILLHRHQKDGG